MQRSSVALGAGLLAIAGALWVVGLRRFVRAGLTRRRKLTWSGLLIVVGIGVGVVLPLREVWTKFLWIMALLPLLALIDVLLLRSRRGMGYWLSACGFEVGTVFAVAALSRVGFDHAGIRALVGHG